jgi:hypothetical protein
MGKCQRPTLRNQAEEMIAGRVMEFLGIIDLANETKLPPLLMV